MSKQNKQQTNTTSMETLWKVLRFIGKYRFLLGLSIILAAVSVILLRKIAPFGVKQTLFDESSTHSGRKCVCDPGQNMIYLIYHK